MSHKARTEEEEGERARRGESERSMVNSGLLLSNIQKKKPADQVMLYNYKY